MRVRHLLYLTLIAACFAGTVSCKRKMPAAANRAPRISGPTTASMNNAALEKIMADLEPIPVLSGGVNYTDPAGEQWIKYDCGIMIHEFKREDSEQPQLGQNVSINYIGTLPGSNKEFDRSAPGKPLVFALGSKSVVKGLSWGVSTMHLGTKRRIFVPSDLAYGEEGKLGSGIEGNQALIFDVELLSIKGTPVKLELPKFEPMGPNLPPETAPATTSAPAP